MFNVVQSMMDSSHNLTAEFDSRDGWSFDELEVEVALHNNAPRYL